MNSKRPMIKNRFENPDKDNQNNQQKYVRRSEESQGTAK